MWEFKSNQLLIKDIIYEQIILKIMYFTIGKYLQTQ